MKQKREKAINVGLLIFAITTLANPNVVVFDYLPDFIGYFIIARALTFYADRVPYFEEARQGFIRLACVSIAKIPAYVTMIMIRGANTADNDVKALFGFTFAAVDLILIVGTVKNLYEGFRYLGERGDAKLLISPFQASKSGRHTENLDSLRSLTYIFATVKCAAASLPELLLLTKLVYNGANTPVFNVAKLYPYVIILAVLTVLIVGIVFTVKHSRFFRAIEAHGGLKNAADGLLDEASRSSLGKRLFVKDICTALTFLTVATFFSVNIRFDNFGGIDLIPNAIIALVAILGIVKLSKHLEISRLPIIFAAVYAAVSSITYALEVAFLSSYSYDELATMTVAKQAFKPVIIGAIAEFTVFCAFIAGLILLLLRFAERHTGIQKDSDRYSRMDAEYNVQTRKRIYIFGATGIIAGLAKLLDTVFKYYSSSALVSTDTDLVTVTFGLIPWFNLVVLGSAVLFICYSLHLFGKLKEDVELKYL